MDPEPIQIICGNCQKFFPLKTIVLHAKSNSKCKHSYSPEQISNLEAQSKKASAEKKNIITKLVSAHKFIDRALPQHLAFFSFFSNLYFHCLLLLDVGLSTIGMPESVLS